MPLFDLPEAELTTYRSDVVLPEDLAEFWSGTLHLSRQIARPPVVEPVDTGLRHVQTWDVTFSGFGGDPIKAWYHRPTGVDREIPAVVSYQGLERARGLPHQLTHWAPAGYAVLEVDTRGQGASGSPGHTPDPHGNGPAVPGSLTRGIEDPATYVYRRIFTDAVLAVDAARELPGIEPDRLILTGGSQGAGIALAAASLSEGIAAVAADVPFLSDFRRGARIAPSGPYTELATYLSVHRDRVEQVFATLDYFDISGLVAMATAPALFSVGLMDQVCPPSTVYAAYNAYNGPKQLRVYPFNDHEGGGPHQQAEQLAWARELLPIERRTDGSRGDGPPPPRT